MGKPGNRLLSATKKGFRIAQGIFRVLQRLQCIYSFFEIYKRGIKHTRVSPLQARYRLWSGFLYHNTRRHTDQFYVFQP